MSLVFYYWEVSFVLLICLPWGRTMKFLKACLFVAVLLFWGHVAQAATPTDSPTSTTSPTPSHTPTMTPSVTPTTTPTPSFTPCPDFTYIPTPVDDRQVARILYNTRLCKQLFAVLSPVRTATWVPTPRTNTIPSNISFGTAALLQIEPLMVRVTPTFFPTPGPCGGGPCSRFNMQFWMREIESQLFAACP